MKTERERLTSYMKIVLCLSAVLIMLPTHALSKETYKFERMWPTFQQPWAFSPIGIAIDADGNVFITDGNNQTIHKLTANGQLITKWGTFGSGDGDFWGPQGVAVDESGNIYVADTGNHRIQKFTAEGKFIAKWGGPGTENEKLDNPTGIAIDDDGYMYVVDSGNNRIQKFTLNGQFISKWGGEGIGEGEFNFYHVFDGDYHSYRGGITRDTNGYLYVTDTYNHRIQKFTSDGQFVAQWGSMGGGNGEFSWPYGITIDSNGRVFVTEESNHRIQIFTPDGQFISMWGSYGSGDGKLWEPKGIAVTKTGKAYVADGINTRIQIFTSEGEFITKWGPGNGDGDFIHANGVETDANGNVYVLDWMLGRIQKFSPDGTYITQWGTDVFGENVGSSSTGIAINSNGYVYVTDDVNECVVKFDSNGQFITKWGTEGTGDGEFLMRGLSGWGGGIAIDASYNVYVADTFNHRIQKFDANGNFITKWGNQGTGDGEFTGPRKIAIGPDGYVYVADSGQYIQKFTSDGQFVSKWAPIYAANGISLEIDSSGYVYTTETVHHHIVQYTSDGQFVAEIGDGYGGNPGSFFGPNDLSIGPGGKLFIADGLHTHVYKKTVIASNSKAIIVAGGGFYQGNNLWDVTEMCANFAYRTLTYQGFTKETIHYLSSDTRLDLDNNGEADDVDADVTNANLKHAITTWASDAEALILYLVDHGGNNTFRMSGTETLSAVDLDTWLDTLQGTISGKVTVIYDACESGTFLPALTPPFGKERIVITSTSPDETAKFVTQGSISFSNYFWTHIFNGVSIKDAFDLTKQALEYSFSDQHPLVDADGNGMGNESADFSLIAGLYIGSGTEIQGDAPVIGSVSSAQTVTGTASALLSAGVRDDDGIARVWAVIRPPDYCQGSSDNPVTELPSVDLMSVGGDKYENTYDSFNIEGTYQIAIYARDRIGNTSIPELTTVSVQTPLRRKAVIVVGCSQSDALWPVVKENASLAYEALTYQGYTDNDVYFMSPVTFSAGVDGLPTLSNIEYVINTWCKESTQDVVLYLVGNGDNGTFQINETETLSATDLDLWLDSLQATIPGKVAVIYDACLSGSFLPLLTPPADKERILISSASFSEAAHFVSQGNICFSKYFWARVSNGANVRDSFLHGKKAMVFSGDGQVPQLDDTGNGIGNEKADGQLASNHTIGTGIMLAGDDPIVGSVSPAQTLSEETSATIWAKDVTSTGTIDKVWAVITTPNYLSGSNSPVTDLPILDLTSLGNNRYEGAYANFTLSGIYNIAVFAMDTKGTLSLPVQTTVAVANGCLSVTGNLSIWVPCAKYSGTQYGFTFNFYSNPDDPSGLYWNLDMATLTGGIGTDCIPVGSDLSIPISCVAYDGVQYGFTLRFYNNPYDQSGLYWKMDIGTFEVK